MSWPESAEALLAEQQRLGRIVPELWASETVAYTIAGCFVCFARGASGPGRPGDRGWAAAVLLSEDRVVASGIVGGEAGASYERGLLALREGNLLETAVRTLSETPDVLLVDATGRDHPRRCGLAFQLGAILEIPTIGVTHRPLLARGEWPPDEERARSHLTIGGEVVGYWLRTRAGVRPLAVHAGWRTDPDTALSVVRSSLAGHRTPEPLRLARTLARERRATASAPAA